MPPRSANATRSANSSFQAFRANMARVAGSTSVITKGADPLRVLAEEWAIAEDVPADRTLERELADAARQDKAAMVDFYADWCVSCKEMENYTFANAEVQSALSGMVLLQADVTANDDQDKALLKKVKVIAPPAILFFDKAGKEQNGYRVVGSMDADQFLDHLNSVFK